MSEIAQELGKTPSTLRIYDPYFCTGFFLSLHGETLLYEP